jgi:AcrR family transcriptional regulator
VSYKTPKEVQERKNANQQKLLETASRIFAEKGYHATTVKDIVDAAEMSVGSFYFYFKNKEDLIGKLCVQATPMVVDIIEREASPGSFGVIEKLCSIVTLAFAFYQERKDLAKVMFVEAIGITPGLEEKIGEVFRAFLRPIEKSLKQYSEEGIVRIDDPELTAMALYGEVHFVVVNWLYGNTASNLTEYAYPLVIHQLKALSIEYDEETVKNCIEKLLSEQCCNCEQN